MRTVQMTLDEDLVERVDRVSKRLRMTRSSFTRRALRDALARYSVLELERKHRAGYQKQSVAADEFAIWETEQAWGDE